MVIAHYLFTRRRGSSQPGDKLVLPDPRVGSRCHQKLLGRVSFSKKFTDQEHVLRAIEEALCRD